MHTTLRSSVAFRIKWDTKPLPASSSPISCHFPSCTLGSQSFLSPPGYFTLLSVLVLERASGLKVEIKGEKDNRIPVIILSSALWGRTKLSNGRPLEGLQSVRKSCLPEMRWDEGRNDISVLSACWLGSLLLSDEFPLYKSQSSSALGDSQPPKFHPYGRHC